MRLRKVIVSVYCTMYTVQCTVGFLWLADLLFFAHCIVKKSSKNENTTLTNDLQNRDHLVQRRQISKSAKVTLQSWYDCVNWLYGVQKISIKWLWPVKVTLKVIKRHLKVFCWSCDGVPLKRNKKLQSLQFVITDQMSLISPLNLNDRSIPLRCFPVSMSG